VLQAGESCVVAYRVRFNKPARDVRFGMLIKTVSGFELGGGAHSIAGEGPALLQPGDCLDVRLGYTVNLNAGTYFMNTGVMGEVNGEFGFLDRKIDALMFRVQPGGNTCSNGIVNFEVEPQWELIQPAEDAQHL
jgi:lipopolysaccharide transport system ATP-binding protein